MWYIVLIVVIIILLFKYYNNNKEFENLKELFNEIENNRNVTAQNYNVNVKNANRTGESKIIFENKEIVKNLYVDDKLDYGSEIVLYDCENGVENIITNFHPKDKKIVGVSVIGYIEVDYWDKEKNTVDVRSIFVNEKYRRHGYFTGMIKRLIEWAEYRDVLEIRLHVSAGRGITQDDLTSIYEKLGFINVGYSKMIYYIHSGI